MRMPVGDSGQIKYVGLFSPKAGQHRHCKVTQKSDDYVRTHLRLRHVFSRGMRPVPAVNCCGTRR